jgi:GT2 family glycosyltransferase
MKSKVAIVILNWNGRKYLEQFLPSVINFSNNPEYKIYVADNNSTDDSLDFIRAKYPEIQIITFKKNYGFAKGYALSLPQVSAKYYILLNSDVEVTSSWIEPIIKLMDDDPQIAAAMPKIRSFSRKEYFEYAGAAGGFIDKYGYPFCQGRILNEIEKDDGQYDQIKDIFWASGACMFLRASAYIKTGGFDGDFFAHMEEIDLCWRLKRLGYKIIYCPDSMVFHVGGGTLPNDNPRKLYYNYRNCLYLLFKNVNYWGFFRLLLPRLALDGISATLYLLQCKFSFFMSVLRAHMRFYYSIGMLINKRRIFNNIIAKNSVGEIYNGSIVFEFFLKNRRNINDLKCWQRN